MLLNIKKLIITFVVISTQAYSWTLAYYNDENGNKLNGDLNNLKNSIRNGQDIKIIWEEESTPQEISFKITQWTISKNKVFALYKNGIGSYYEIDRLKFRDNNFHAFFRFDTDGYIEIVKYDIETNNYISTTNLKGKLKWFVQ